MNEDIIKHVKMIYNYLNISTEVFKSDVIIGLGCMDKGIPKECSRLYKNGYGNYIVFSGNVGKGTRGCVKYNRS